MKRPVYILYDPRTMRIVCRAWGVNAATQIAWERGLAFINRTHPINRDILRQLARERMLAFDRLDAERNHEDWGFVHACTQPWSTMAAVAIEQLTLTELSANSPAAIY
jgi:hypothetical protein